MKQYSQYGLESMRKRAWDGLLYEEDQFLYTLDRAEKEHGEKFKLKYWVELENIHEKYDYWRIYPKTDATLESIERLKEARRDIEILNKELKNKLVWLTTRDKNMTVERMEDRKKKKSTKPKRKVCKCKK